MDYKYYNSVTFQEKRKVYGYIIKFTADEEQRMKNPEQFYDFVPKKLEENPLSDVQKKNSQAGRILPIREGINFVLKRKIFRSHI